MKHEKPTIQSTAINTSEVAAITVNRMIEELMAIAQELETPADNWGNAEHRMRFARSLVDAVNIHGGYSTD